MSPPVLGAAAAVFLLGWLLAGRRQLPDPPAATPGPGRRPLGALAGSAARRLTGSRREASLRLAVIELAEVLATELRGGAVPREALRLAVLDQPLLADLGDAVRDEDGDLASALRRLSAGAGGHGAAHLATVWTVCERTGGRLAGPVARLASALRDDEQVRRELTAQLAGARATALLLAGLPLLGLLMGFALGADPLHVLLGSRLGPLLLVPGLALQTLGAWWTARIARRAQPH